MKNIIFVVGSTRKNSFNLQLAKIVEEKLKEKVCVSYLNFSQVPFFNQDTEFPTPQSVSDVRKVISNSDGLWIFSPEYNQSYPGYLKNLLDWLSRPIEQNNYASGNVIKGKKITISGVSGKSAAANSRKKLSELLIYLQTDLCYGEGVGIALDGKAFSTDILTISSESNEKLTKQIDFFLNFIGNSI